MNGDKDFSGIEIKKKYHEFKYWSEVKTCSKGNYIQCQIHIPEDFDRIEIFLSDKDLKEHPHFLMIFPTNRNGMNLGEVKEEDKRIIIVRKEFDGVSTFDVQIPDYWDPQDLDLDIFKTRFLGSNFWDPQNRIINLSSEGLRLKVIKGKNISKKTNGNKVLLAVKFTNKTSSKQRVDEVIKYSPVILNEAAFVLKVKSVPISVICNQGVHIIFVILNERLVLKNIEGKKLQLMLLRYKSGVKGFEEFEKIASSRISSQTPASSQNYDTMAAGHVLQFETEINCDAFNFKAYVKLGVFDEDMPNINKLLNQDASPIDCENDEMIKIVGHISPDEYCVCQISKRNSENIQAKGKSDGLALRVHPSEHFELAENQAKKQRLQTDGSSGKNSTIDYETILWLDENWLKVKKVGQVFLQVFGRKFLVLGVVCFILPSIFAMIHEE